MQLGSCFPLARWFIAFAMLAASAPQSLREAASVSGVLVGTAVRPSLLSEAAYATTLAREFNMLEPEDVLKWSVVRAAGESFDFRQGDEIVHFSRAHAMKVRGHCLVWDHSNPEWLAEGRFAPA